MNLTRHNGAGSIAHELFHSFDSRLSKKWSNGRSLLSESIAKGARLKESNGLPTSDIERFAAFEKIVKGCYSPSDYLSNAKSLGGQKNGNKYWDTPAELCARAFEAFIQDQAVPLINHARWLAHGTLESDYPINGMHPYPCGEDRIRLKEIFKSNLPIIFQQIER